MRRTTLLFALVLLAGAPARAQLYPEPNRVGIYFDTGAMTNWRTVQGGYFATAYLILTNPTGVGYGVDGFECRVNAPANAWLYDIQLPTGSINIRTLPSLTVGLATPLPLTPTVTLASIHFMANNSSPGAWSLTPVPDADAVIPGAMAYGTSDPVIGHLYVMQPSHVPAAVFNPDLSFSVDVQPDASRGAWRLTGPGGYACEASGDSTISGLPFGSYTIAWKAAGVWAPPAQATITRTHDQWSGACVFSGSFTERAQVVVSVQPAGLAAPWFLMGPDGFWLQGTGDRALPGVAPGVYTLAWAPHEGWRTPEPSTAMLAAATGQTITFEGVYHSPAAVGGVAGLLQLRPARPNPFNPRTTIAFELPEAARVRLEVFDLAGRRVATLLEADLPAGANEATWDGTDARGAAAPSGSYIARLSWGGQVRSEGLQLVR